MTTKDKLNMLKAFMRIDGDADDALLTAYLNAAEMEILSWKYSYCKDEMPSEIDCEDEMTQIHAVIAGYNLAGAENETNHSENGVSRTFKFSDMIVYIRTNVIPYAKLI